MMGGHSLGRAHNHTKVHVYGLAQFLHQSSISTEGLFDQHVRYTQNTNIVLAQLRKSGKGLNCSKLMSLSETFCHCSLVTQMSNK